MALREPRKKRATYVSVWLSRTQTTDDNTRDFTRGQFKRRRVFYIHSRLYVKWRSLHDIPEPRAGPFRGFVVATGRRRPNVRHSNALSLGTEMVRRTKEEALQTRNRILDAAEQVFYDKGVSRTSLADIAAQAGVTRGAIYWHFENKGDLFTAMFDRVLLPLDELSAPPADGADDDPLTRLARMLKWCLQAESADPRRRASS